MTHYINNDKPVFISYAGKSKRIYAEFANHSVELDDKNLERDFFVKNLLKYFELANIKCEIDTMDVKGGSITEFEKKIGDAKYVVIVLSDKYFISPHCMYEWDLIHKNTLGKKIFYTYFTGETIYGDDGTIFKGCDVPIKEMYGDYYTKIIEPALIKRYQQMIDIRRKAWFNLSDVEAYFCNGDINETRYIKSPESAAYLFKTSYPDIPAKLKNASMLKDAQDDNKAYELTKYVKELFEIGQEPQSKVQNQVYTLGQYISIDFSKCKINMNMPDSMDDSQNVFYGREKKAEELHSIFFEDQRSIVSLVAIGGTGKTYFAHKYKEMYQNDYKIIHHIILDRDIEEDFVKYMTNFINCHQFSDCIAEEPDFNFKLDAVIDVLKMMQGMNLLILDINVTEQSQFKTKILYKLKKLKDNWHVLVMSRHVFSKTNGLARIYLSGFENEKDAAVKMFRDISNIDKSVISDNRLIEIFATDGFYFHPMLISVLASYCRRKSNLDFNSVQTLLNRVKFQELPDDMKCTEDSVNEYLKKLVDFNSYGKECEIILRHFILWEYNNIPFESIVESLRYYNISDIDLYLDDLVNNTILTKNQKEYRRKWLTVKDQCDILFKDTNKEKYIYDEKREAELREMLANEGFHFKYFDGYRMHGMLGDTLREKAMQEITVGKRFDYSNYLNRIKDVLVAPHNMSYFRSLQQNIRESLLIHCDILQPSEDLYVFAAQHYYYYPSLKNSDSVIEKAISVVHRIQINDFEAYANLDNLAVAFHDSARVLINIGNKEAAQEFCKTAIKIRETILQSLNLYGIDKKDNIKKLAIEYFTYGLLLKEQQQIVESVQKCQNAIDLISSEQDISTKAMLLQFLVIYRRIFNDIKYADLENVLVRELSQISLDKYSLIPKVVEVKGGIFSMGSEEEESEHDEHPIFKVKLDDYLMAKYPVTQLQWDFFMEGEAPSFFRVDYHRGIGADYPMYNVSWTEISECFLKKLNKITNQQFRLPSEAEWEYAARGGHKTSNEEKQSKKYSGVTGQNIEKVAYYIENSDASMHSVGELESNELGIYDMSGNVWEWCQDWYQEDFYGQCKETNEITDNPCNNNNTSVKVIRGGCWDNDSQRCRVSNRRKYAPNKRDHSYGCRLCLDNNKDN